MKFYRVKIRFAYKGLADLRPAVRTLNLFYTLDDSLGTLDTEDKRQAELISLIDTRFSDIIVGNITYAKIQKVEISRVVVPTEFSNISYSAYGDLPAGETAQLVHRRRVCSYLDDNAKTRSIETIEPKDTSDTEILEVGCWDLLTTALPVGFRLFSNDEYEDELLNATRSIYLATRK